MRGLALYRQFQTVVQLTANVRARDHTLSFPAILDRLRRWNLSPQDLDVLNAQCLGKLPPHVAATFMDDNVQVLVTLNADRIQRNLDHVAAVPGPVAEIASEDISIQKHLGHVDSPTLFAMLQPMLWLGAGVRVSVTSNLCTANGIVRGATGTVLLVVYHPGAAPPMLPRLVLVGMDQPVAPTLRDSLNLGPRFANVLPFTQVKARCPDGCCSRCTLPLEIARAMTVHKAQGATITRPTVLELNATAERKWPGITYTAFSRFSAIDTFALAKPLPRDLINAVSAGIVTSGRKREMDRLSELAADTQRAHSASFRGPASVGPLHSWAASLSSPRHHAAAGPAQPAPAS
eukprot:3417601-Rhodomonas_salina.1